MLECPSCSCPSTRSHRLSALRTGPDEVDRSFRSPLQAMWLHLNGDILGDLRRITSLPEIFGRHACEECGRHQMRRLPDGIFLCPACGSEVLPAKAFWRQG